MYHILKFAWNVISSFDDSYYQGSDVIQCNFTFNIISVVSWWWLLVADIALPHWNAIPWVLDMTPPGPHTQGERYNYEIMHQGFPSTSQFKPQLKHTVVHWRDGTINARGLCYSCENTILDMRSRQPAHSIDILKTKENKNKRKYAFCYQQRAYFPLMFICGNYKLTVCHNS